MPELDGIEVCQELRKSITAPIIFLSSKSSLTEKSIWLIARGDDYIGKPFESIELLARVRAHLRRNRILTDSDNVLNWTQEGTIDSGEKLICHPGLLIDLEKYIVVANGNEIPLSPKEFKLLALLAQNPGVVFEMKGSFRLSGTLIVLATIAHLRFISVTSAKKLKRIQKIYKR